MQFFSAWPVRCCLVGVAGFTLGATLMVDGSRWAANQPAESRPFFLEAQGEDRGSGRLWQPAFIQKAGIRGSGRINPDPQVPNPQLQAAPMAYRGSGRIEPQRPNSV